MLQSKCPPDLAGHVAQSATILSHDLIVYADAVSEDVVK